ncbi:MAG: PspC domain-containing protein [Prevotellaceae bacterium]|jgi:phage shock protein PspC (stress-responsive transcriptional regulator)|nr:PspC domain-containing protein [Prevotellaceae bacterium]
MKKVITASIGGKSFVIDEDAFAKLQNYLDSFKATIVHPKDAEEIMEEIEFRVAEILQEHLRNEMQSVNCAIVDIVIAQLGQPEGARAHDNNPYAQYPPPRPRKRLYRDPDHRRIGGVCSGVAAFFDLDILLVRVIFLMLLIFGGAGFWLYIILWIVAPAARTVAEKLEMRGEPATAENIKNAR